MKHFLKAAFLMTTLSAGAAQAEFWDCTVNGKHSGNWIADRVLFNVEKGDATVLDGIIKYIKEDWIPAKINKNSAEKISFSWKVTDIKTTDHDRQVARYSAQINRADNSVQVRVRIPGYSYTDRAKGTCEYSK